jgi:CheY-like chemotaxis protein
VTDLATPRLRGRETAQQIADLGPGIRVLFGSGYPAELRRDEGVLEPSTHLIEKPFTPRALALKVREALER